MADPATMAGASIAGKAASGIVGAFGSLWAGDAQAKQMEYQAGIARLNKQIAEQNADYTRAVGEIGAQTEGMKTRFQIGQTRAIQSGRGIDIDTGSPALVRESEREIGLYDQATIRANAAHRAYGYEIDAVQEEAKAAGLEAGAKNAKTAAKINALSSILGGSTSVADKWYQYSDTFGSSGGSEAHHMVPFGA